MCLSISQEPLDLLKFEYHFEFLGQFALRCMYYFLKNVDNFDTDI